VLQKLKKKVIKHDVAVQTENDIITDESPSFRAVPTSLCKWELVGDSPEFFEEVDSWVAEVTQHYWTRPVKKLGKVVRALLSRLQPAMEEGEEAAEVLPKYRGKEDLIKVRAFFRWIAENLV
jgi:hypothetical protein